MELILPMKAAVKIEIGCTYEESKTIFSDFQFEEDSIEDSGLSRQSLNFSNFGLSLIFDHYHLTCIRSYIRHDEYSPFKGKFGFLNESFWENPSDDSFIKTCIQAGYEKWPKAYPMSINMVTETTRLSYTSRPKMEFISFDDGALIRKKSIS